MITINVNIELNNEQIEDAKYISDELKQFIYSKLSAELMLHMDEVTKIKIKF